MDARIGIWPSGTHGQCCDVEVTGCSQSSVISREGHVAQLQIRRNGTCGHSWVLRRVLVLTFLKAGGGISGAFSGRNLDLSLSAHTSLPRLHPNLEQIQALKETRLGLNKIS